MTLFGHMIILLRHFETLLIRCLLVFIILGSFISIGAQGSLWRIPCILYHRLNKKLYLGRGNFRSPDQQKKKMQRESLSPPISPWRATLRPGTVPVTPTAWDCIAGERADSSGARPSYRVNVRIAFLEKVSAC